MKAYKIVSFIFCIIAMLAIMSWQFPAEGIQVGPIKFEFPSLADVLGDAEETDITDEPVISPEELLQLRLDALVAAKDNEFLEYIDNSEARFYMPDSDLTYFDDLFAKLENSQNELIRIVHYGDSQIEDDRMSSYLRERFQETFGGSGVGMLPFIVKRTTQTLAETITPEERFHYYLAYGPASSRAKHHRYGPMAQVAHVDTTATLTFRTRDAERFPHCQTFQRIRVRMQGSGTFSFSAEGKTTKLTCDTTIAKSEVRLFEAVLPTPVKKGSLVVKGNMDIYSIQLDGLNGVTVDNIAMRGCSGTIFTSIDRKTIEGFYLDENVSLIILQYGGNSVPYIKDEKSIQKFCAQTQQQIELFHSLAPNAKILYIGPSDMSTSIKGEKQTYPLLPDMVAALIKAVNESGAAYWNMFEAMGGPGSMVQWVKSKTHLAADDYIHFTNKGAQRISEILYDTFDIYYKYYRFRNYERYSMADSLTVDDNIVRTETD